MTLKCNPIQIAQKFNYVEIYSYFNSTFDLNYIYFIFYLENFSSSNKIENLYSL